MTRLAALVALLSFLALPARAEWVAGKAERVFGPETTEADACRAAERLAREAALRARLGERVASEDTQICTEKGEAAECSLHRAAWSMVDGDIAAVRDRRAVTRDGPLAGFRTCQVSLDADVVIAKGQPDPGFDFTLRMETRVFRDGDELSMGIEPSQPMYITVFQWLPYDQSASPVTRLFPNKFDSDNYFAKAGTVPTGAGAPRYGLRVGFPANVPEGARLADEYLLVVATRTRVEFRDAYGIDELKGRLLEIPRADARLVKRGYGVVEGP